MSRLLIGVTGGIAAYKAVELVRLAGRAGHAVRVIQTPTSRRFVGGATFSGITGAPVLTGEFEDDPLRGAYPGDPADERAPISHLALVAGADAYLIAPASANTLAKLAHGHADNLVTTAALAADCPVLVAPAMNDRMYRHPATEENLERLRGRGVTIIGPADGELASHGERGLGRMAEPADLLAACEATIHPAQADSGAWLGRRVLVTAGGTREPIDSVRYIGNRSSGRMGVALAARAAARGAEVTLVAANLAVPPPAGVRVIEVHTAAQLATATREEFPACDVLLMAAAVADFRPRDPAADKLRKAGGAPTLILEPTEDVIATLAGRRREGQVVVGFAAEHGDAAVAGAREKLVRKGLDAVVVNDISRADIGFDTPENEVTVVTREGERPLPRAGKGAIADDVLHEVGRLLSVKESDHRTTRADGNRAAGV
ncbi:MAG: bifunctional phosphopantothenoylcysteine decarboxylase/phosphopantothenate--cysteine ligase CoaBC [Solirubrobacterales bacterium]|nr:bifunctional phosphopantothenoylcysteine decarboxylase/phosphopantothenate--cysteine ligase CoaBC [Solirubrobacterales bacterium]